MTIETPSRPEQLDAIDVVVKNFSDQVILNLYFRIYTRSQVTWLSSDVLGPGSKWNKPVQLNPVMNCDRPEYSPELFEFNLWFTDATGGSWHRIDRQQPVRIENHPAQEWAAFPSLAGRD